MAEDEIVKLRTGIDEIDAKIVNLLDERARVVKMIGRAKTREGRAYYDPAREKDVLDRVSSLHAGEFPAPALTAVFREIMGASLSLERPLTISYFGPEATNTHLAAMKHFGHFAEYRPAKSIGDVFLEVEKGLSAYGVVPIENSTEGAVVHTLDMMVNSPLRVVSEVMLEISHYLLSDSPLSEIRKVYSHPQPIAQCRNWLETNLPTAEVIEAPSTARAAQMVKGKKGEAAIATRLAAEIIGLNIIAEQIQDFAGNTTRFLVLGTEEPPRTGADKTAIAFSMKDRVGALLQMLKPFEVNNINLTKLESRPARREGWKYIFFVDLEGHQEDPAVASALKELSEHCVFLKVLGSYPVRDAQPIKS